MSNHIGPLVLENVHHKDNDDAKRDGSEIINTVCSVELYNQLQGLCEASVKNTYNSRRILTTMESRWGILPVNTSENMRANEHLTHSGLYHLLDVQAVQMGVRDDIVTAQITAELLSKRANEILTIRHSKGGEDGSSIKLSDDFEDIDSETLLEEDFTTFNTTDTWFPQYSENMTSGNIAPSAGKLGFTGQATTNGTWSYLWTVLRQTLPDEFTMEFTLEWTALPSSGANPHHLNLFLMDGKPSNAIELEYKDTIRTVLDLQETGAKISIDKRVRGNYNGVTEDYSLTSSQKVIAVKLKLEGGTGQSKLTVWMDKDYSGTGEPDYTEMFGPADTGFNYDNDMYLILAMENASNNSCNVKCSYLNIYETVGAVQPNIVVGPVGCVPDRTPDFYRTSEDGEIPCFKNPTTFPTIQVTPENFYKGTVKALKDDYTDGVARLVTGNEFVLDPESFILSNGLIRLVPDTQSVAFEYYTGYSWENLDTFTLPNPINLIRPFLVEKDRFILQIDRTLWELKSGSYALWITHEHDAIGYTLRSHYYHDGTVETGLGEDNNVSMDSQFYCNVYDYTNLVEENIARCGDETGDTTGFNVVGGLSYTNVLEEGIALCNDKTLFHKNTDSESIDVWTSFEYAERSLTSIIVGCPGTNDDEGTWFTASGLTIGETYTLCSCCYAPASIELGIYIPGPGTYGTFTPNAAINEKRLSFVATATSHDINIHVTAKANTFFAVALNMVAHGAIGNSPIVLPGETGNSVRVMTAPAVEDQMRVVYTGFSPGGTFTQSDIDELVAIGATDVVNLAYYNLLDDYETKAEHINTYATLFKNSGIRFHAGVNAFKHYDDSEEDPADPTYTNQMITYVRKLFEDCPDLEGLSFDDYIYPIGLHDTDNEAAEALALTNFAINMREAVHNVKSTAKLSGAILPLDGVQGNDIESFANEFDFIIWMGTYRFFNNVSTYIRDRLELFLKLTGDNIVIPAILTFYSDADDDNYWPVQQLISDIYDILELNPQGYAIFDWTRHPEGLYCPVEDGIKNQAIRAIMMGRAASEGISFLTSWTTGVQNTLQFQYNLPNTVQLTVNVGGNTSTITGTGEMETFTATGIPSTTLVSIYTPSTLATPLLIEEIKAAPGASIPASLDDGHRMTIVKKDPATIKSDSIPASDKTGIIVYDNSLPATADNGYLSLAREWFNPTWQRLILQSEV